MYLLYHFSDMKHWTQIPSHGSLFMLEVNDGSHAPIRIANVLSESYFGAVFPGRSPRSSRALKDMADATEKRNCFQGCCC